MPRTKFDRPKYPPIDAVRAAVLERKMSLGLTWDEIAEGSDVSGTYLRKLVHRPSDEWNPKTRNAVCKQLGINIKTEIVDLFGSEGVAR